MKKAILKTDLRKIGHLLKSGWPVNGMVNEERLNGLGLACKVGNLQVVKELVERGADVDWQEEVEKWSGLIICAINGHFECAAFLVYKGARKDITGEDGRTALDFAEEGLSSAKEGRETTKWKKLVALLREENIN